MLYYFNVKLLMTFAVSSSSPLSTRCSAAGLRGGGSSPDATSPTRTRTALSSARKHWNHCRLCFWGNFKNIDLCCETPHSSLSTLIKEPMIRQSTHASQSEHFSGGRGKKKENAKIYGIAHLTGLVVWGGRGGNWQWLNMNIIIINRGHAELTKRRGADVKQAINTFVPIICSNDGGSMTCRKEDVSPLSI